MTIAIFLTYGAIATFFPDSTIVGSFGTYLGKKNLYLFGYLGYIDFIFLLYPLWRIHRMRSLKDFDVEGFAAWTLFIFSLLILQALTLSDPMRGWLGASLVDFLRPFIGNAGVWLFWLMTLTLSGLILWGERVEWDFSAYAGKWRRASNSKKERVDDSADAINPYEYHEESEVSVPFDVAKEEAEISVPESAMEDQEEPEIRLIKREEIEVSAEPIVMEKIDPIPEKRPEAESEKIEKETEHSVEIVQEIEENKKLLAQIDKGVQEKPKNFKLPKLDFLQKPPKRSRTVNEAEIDEKIRDLLEKLSKFKIDGDVVRTYAGPVVTTFEFKPAAHIKVSKILNLQDDLAMALKAQTIRIQAPVPGKDVVGIEIPNKEVETIYLREILESDIFKNSKSPLTIALGKDIVGKPFVTDLKKLPHLLIAGTTGSGKSVGINAMILSLLYRNSPDQLRLMMIDPKMLEFSIYNDIPHLLTPVITQPKKAITALSNMVAEMERRYQLMSQSRTKNIETYNEKMKKEGKETLPYIVVIIDELADLMMTGGKDVEFSIARLAQMARASGIHLIVATQRPSVDVVTGLIKANLPSRISFKVGQKIDSKVILDTVGAESLLGRGDMLFTIGGGTLIRLHAPWSSEEEIERIVEYLKKQRPVEYDEHFLMDTEEGGASEGGGHVDDIDPLFEEAKNIVLSEKKTSISYLQRRLQIGYNRAARIVEQLELMGVVSAPNAKGQREILN